MTELTKREEFARKVAAVRRDNQIVLEQTASCQRELESTVRESKLIVERALRTLRAALR